VRQVVTFKERNQLALGGFDGLLDRSQALGSERSLAVGWNCRGQVFQGFEQWAGRGGLIGGELENGEYRGRSRLRLDKSGSDAALEVVNLLIKVNRQRSQPGYPGDRIAIRVDDGGLGRIVPGIEKSVPVVEWYAPFIEARCLDPYAEPPREQAPSQGILATRRRWRQSRQSHLQSLECGDALILGGFAHIGPARSFLGIRLPFNSGFVANYSFEGWIPGGRRGTQEGQYGQETPPFG
jgi:hypothetical protein